MTRIKRLVLNVGFGAGAETNYVAGSGGVTAIQWYETLGVIALWKGGDLPWQCVPVTNLRSWEVAELPKGFVVPDKPKEAAA
jgi:hypothetical protein